MEIKGIDIRGKVSRLPVIQGGMGVGISLSNLAGAVAANGGIGIISAATIGFREKDYKENPVEANLRALREEIRKAREKAAGGIIGVNIMVASSNYRELVAESVKSGIDLIISGAGLPLELPELVKNSRTAIAPIVSSGKAAKVICKSWLKKHDTLPDLVVVEGKKAGGHLGFKRDELLDDTAQSLEEIVSDVREVVAGYEEKAERKIPVIAAGGIWSGEDVCASLKTGADGVQMGTRFIGTEECDATDAYKAMFLNASEDDIMIVQSPVGMPGRAIRNSFVERVSTEREKVTSCQKCLVPCDPATTPYCISKALINAVKGDVDNGLIFTGTNGHLIKEITTVKDILEEIRDELEKC